MSYSLKEAFLCSSCHLLWHLQVLWHTLY